MLSTDSENCFKNQKVKGNLWNIVLVNPNMATNWYKGIPTTTLKMKLRDILFFLQKYITYEGR